MLEVKIFKVGNLLTNCYFVRDSEEDCCILIDPGGEISNIRDEISNMGSFKYILLTHGHFDHILKAKEYRDITGAKIVISKLDSIFTNDNHLNLSDRFLRRSKTKLENFDADILLDDGDILPFGKNEIRILSTPGHTQGSVCYIIDNVIFSGDTLFCNNCGSTRFPTGDVNELNISLGKLYSLEGNYKLYPGHSEPSYLEQERGKHINL